MHYAKVLNVLNKVLYLYLQLLIPSRLCASQRECCSWTWSFIQITLKYMLRTNRKGWNLMYITYTTHCVVDGICNRLAMNLMVVSHTGNLTLIDRDSNGTEGSAEQQGQVHEPQRGRVCLTAGEHCWSLRLKIS